MRLELRDLQLFVALARHEHFTRAAEACGISQPALSLRIANLEAALGVPLVRRGARFAGFTEDGQRLLRWARRILAEHEAMLAELGTARGTVAGHVTLGVIPTALGFAARLSAEALRRYPAVALTVRSASAREIAAGLVAGRFDIGISYTVESSDTGSETGGETGGDTGGEAGRESGARRMRSDLTGGPERFLYRESYVLLASAAVLPPGRRALSWAEAATLPLALLSPDMKNRQIIDSAFRRAGARARPVFETNSLSTLYAFLAESGAATIAPANAAETRAGVAADLATLDLVEPELRRSIAAFTPDTAFEAPAVTALLNLATEIAGAPLPAHPPASAPSTAPAQQSSDRS
ncbi:MAG: LysR family transcriptional regulator [Pseudomonadota bacterium]